MTQPTPPRLQLFAAFAAVYLFWGATFLAVRYAVAVVPPMLIIGVRCAGGALILFAWLAWRGELERPTMPQWRTAALAGLLLFLGSHVSMAWAEQRMSSGQAALFCSSIPLWVVLMEAIRERTVPAARVLAGIALGIVGVGILAGGGALNSGTTGDRLLLLFASFCWAAGSLVGRHGARPSVATQATAMQLAAGALWVLTASVMRGELATFSVAQLTTRAALSLVFLVVCGTVLAFGSFTWLLRVASPAAVSSYAFVNPMVALFLGVLVGDDALSGRVVASAALVIGA
ncbi:MAG: EamA family transporter, partial [Gemmatimonadetes bacterium]|nr:EamA family transporter [Gemmatimonadota bacterium]